MFQLMKIIEHLESSTSVSKMDVPNNYAPSWTRRMMRLFYGPLSVEVETSETPFPQRLHLKSLLHQLESHLNELVDFLSQRFLTHTVSVRQLEDAANQ